MYKNQSDSVMNKRFTHRRKYAPLLDWIDIREGKAMYCSENDKVRYLNKNVEEFVIADMVERAIQKMMYDPDRQAKFDG
jgi:hypothetical protein